MDFLKYYKKKGKHYDFKGKNKANRRCIKTYGSN